MNYEVSCNISIITISRYRLSCVLDGLLLGGEMSKQTSMSVREETKKRLDDAHFDYLRSKGCKGNIPFAEYIDRVSKGDILIPKK